MTTAPSIDLKSVRARFCQIRDALCNTFVEREQAIDCMLLAALSGNHALLAGPPGTAKSMLVNAVRQSFQGARMFEQQVSAFTTEDELFGPVKVSALKADTWERNTTGRLADCDIAFLDEVFKGTGVALNTVLQAMNERVYKGQSIPLRLMCGATNELPETADLAAFYDRFLLRTIVEYIEADAAWLDLIANPPTYTPPAVITMAEWTAAVQAAARVTIPAGVLQHILKIRKKLKDEGVIVSDRRWVALMRVLRAAAWLDGVKEVELDHLPRLRYGLWQEPQHIATVESVLNAVEAGPVRRITQVVDPALKAYAQRPTDPEAYRAALAGSPGKPGLATVMAEAKNQVEAMFPDGMIPKRVYVQVERKLGELEKVCNALQEDMQRIYIDRLSFAAPKITGS